VTQDPAHDIGIGEEGEHNHRHRLASRRAPGAGKSIDVEQTAQQLRPRDATAGWGRRLRRCAGMRTPADLHPRGHPALDVGIFPPWRRGRKVPPHVTAVGEEAVIAHLVGVGKRDQGRQPAEKIEGLEDEVGGPLCMRPGTAQAVDDMSVLASGEALLGEGSAQSVTEKSLQALPVIGRDRLRGVQREAPDGRTERFALGSASSRATPHSPGPSPQAGTISSMAMRTRPTRGTGSMMMPTS
jgi:hypothetical protein